METGPEDFADAILGFTVPARHGRGRVVRLDTAVDTILAAHDYHPPVKHLLAEALVLAALIGSLIKESGGQMTMQAQTRSGVVKLLVCDWREGELRGYVDYDRDAIAQLGTNPSLGALFGEGYLAITFDRPGGQGRYQGIVPLEGGTLAEACENYFVQSEQLPSLIRVAVRSDGAGCEAAGLLLQHLAEGEEGRERLHVRLDHPEWDHLAIMGGTVRHDELLDGGLSLQAIVWRLFHEEPEIRVAAATPVRKGCRCSAEHYNSVLRQFPPEELEEMRDQDGRIPVDCAFCSRVFPIDI